MKRKFELTDGELVAVPPFWHTPLKDDEDPLELSIQKWEAIVALYEKGCFDFLTGGNSTCALCQKFGASPALLDCKLCPVCLKSGNTACQGTPHDSWVQARTDDTRLVAARAEVEFLKELRND